MRKTILPLLLASAVCISPAYANWFSNPRLGINLNVGSAPNPKPAPIVVAAIPPPAPPPAYAPLPPLPPPPPIAEAPPLPPPPAPIVRKFMVFFDFDRSTLHPDALEIVAEAVRTAKQLGPVRIVITGHTDTVGSFRYNQGLSQRRAQAVKKEMMRLGMNASDIETVGRSFSDPLVPTGPGVREPQNRRAVIDLGTGGPVASAE